MPHGRRDLPGSGIAPTSPGGADGSLTTEPPGKPIKSLFELLKMTATSLTLQCEKYRLNVMILHLILFPLFYNQLPLSLSLPGGSDGKQPPCHAGGPCLIPGSGRFPWRREWQPAPVFLPGESHGKSWT